MDLTALIEFIAPGSILRVSRAPGGVEGDPWPGIDTWSAGDYQTALDSLVEWIGAPLTGAEVHANIAAFNARPAPPPTPDHQAELDAAIAAATTLPELKAALLGQGNAGKVAGRAV